MFRSTMLARRAACQARRRGVNEAAEAIAQKQEVFLQCSIRPHCEAGHDSRCSIALDAHTLVAWTDRNIALEERRRRRPLLAG
jgi:hypothetical protein